MREDKVFGLKVKDNIEKKRVLSKRKILKEMKVVATIK
jgi:hypothetical protein